MASPLLVLAAALVAMVGCTTPTPYSTGAHLGLPAQPAITPAVVRPVATPTLSPLPVTASPLRPLADLPLPPEPTPQRPVPRFTLVVLDQEVKTVLRALARESRVNLDIHPGVEGTVTLNAIEQTLEQLLDRIARQTDVRWERQGGTISVLPDTPYLRTYPVNYVNLERDAVGSMGVSTQSNATGSGVTAQGSQNAGGQNMSIIAVANSSRNRFWVTLERNLKDLLRDTDKLLPDGSSETFVESGRNQNYAQTGVRETAQKKTRKTAAAVKESKLDSTSVGSETSTEEIRTLTFREAASIIVNAEAGLVLVRANSRQHEKVEGFLKQIVQNASRQVLIEATVVEVTLNDDYQAGVDWSALGLDGGRFKLQTNFIGAALNAAPFGTLEYKGKDLSGTLKLLESFGTTRVLSSPKVMALSNQTAVLKVVDNLVYFIVKAETITSEKFSVTNYTSTQNTVPIGLVLSLTAQVSEQDEVILNVRPSLTRLLGYRNDPNPSLAASGVISRVPEVQTREIESVMRLASGKIGVLGGLMQDSVQTNRDGLPLLSRIPLAGDAVSMRNDTTKKTELVVFLRPTVVRDPSVESELAAYKRFLPSLKNEQAEQNEAGPTKGGSK